VSRAGWTGSRIVPGNWQTLRRRILRRAGGECEACGIEARLEVDHIVNVAEGGDHSLANLQALCPGCHRVKTRAEQQRGLARRRARMSSQPAPHPGLITEGR
jgi:5-methylcytosine-specific restriction enzyme A